MIRIKVRTHFDITATGVTGHFKNSQKLSVEEWNNSRNQQRSSVRTYVDNILYCIIYIIIYYYYYKFKYLIL